MIPIWFREITAPTTKWVEALPEVPELFVVRCKGEILAILVEIHVNGKPIRMKAVFDPNTLISIQRGNSWITARLTIRELIARSENTG